MNPLAAGAGFLAIFLLGGPLTGGNIIMSIGIGVVVYLIVAVLLGSRVSGGSLEERGNRAADGERSMTKEVWKKKHAEERKKKNTKS